MKAIALLISLISAAPTTTFDKGPSFEVTYDSAKKMLKYAVDVPTNMYLALSYGTAATAVDMVTFQGEGDGIVTDYWLGATGPAVKDTQQDYKNTLVTSQNGMFKFVTYRAVDTKEATQDSVIKCDSSQAFKWAVNSKGSAIGTTDKSGDWTLDLGLNADCTTKTVAKADPKSTDDTTKKDDTATAAKDSTSTGGDSTPAKDTAKDEAKQDDSTPKQQDDKSATAKNDDKSTPTAKKDDSKPASASKPSTPAKVYEPYMKSNKPVAIAPGAPANGNWPKIDSTSNDKPFNIDLLPIGQKCMEASQCQTQCCEKYIPSNAGKEMSTEQLQLFENPLNIMECRKASTPSCIVEEKSFPIIIGSIIVAFFLLMSALFTHQKAFAVKNYTGINNSTSDFPSNVNVNVDNGTEMKSVKA